jgi:hypothetical protein
VVTVLGRFDVLPLYNQVHIRDPRSTDFPQWETGDEPVVADSQCIAVATRSDVAGPISVEVRSGDSAEDLEGWGLLFDGELLLTGDTVVVGNYVANEIYPVTVGQGWHRVRVWGSPAGERPSELVAAISDSGE